MEEKFDISNARNLDEIVFRDRNKEYGAYAMRKKYSRYVSRSLIISIAILLLGALIPFFIFKQSYSANQEQEVAVDIMDMNKPKEETAPPPPPPPPEATVEQKAKFVAPIVSSDTTETTDFSQDDLNQTANTQVTTEEIIIEDDNTNQVIEEVVETPIFTVVEEQPEFVGGEATLREFLSKNLTYPQMAKETGIQGTVFLTFVVNENGKVSDVRLLRGIGGGCDEEAIRVVNSMPNWKPGKQSGKAVRVQFNLPVKFILN
jgi:protein TonB